jgi:hypothetical protein
MFNPNPEQFPDYARPERIIGMTLDGPHIPPPQLDPSLVEGLSAIVELREGMARAEGHRQARLQGTRAATEVRQAQTEGRRKAILLLCNENGWRFDARGNPGRIKRRLEKDPRFRGADNMPLHMVSRRTVADDLIYLATTS